MCIRDSMKTHAKLSLVVRKEKTGLKTYVHIGTGNYHPDNAKIYSDLSLFSCDKFICDDVQKVHSNFDIDDSIIEAHI